MPCAAQKEGSAIGTLEEFKQGISHEVMPNLAARDPHEDHGPMNNKHAPGLGADIRHLAEAIMPARKIVLTTHRNPDGDGLGAELAMREGLMVLGKSVTVLNDSVTPSEYRFLDRYGVLQHYSPPRHKAQIESADMIIILDAGAPERTGAMQAPLRRFGGTTAVIDHHLGPRWGNYSVVAPMACSTTALVHALLMEFHTPLSRTLAESLYVGILVDTLGFRNANTSEECLKLAAELVGAGADPAQLWQRVFGERALGQLRLEGDFLSSLQTSLGGKLVWDVVDRSMMVSHQQDESAIEGFVERALDIRGAQLAVLFVEESEQETRVSFRSREPIAVDGLAQSLGGGGHRLAAGAVVHGSVARVTGSVLKQARGLLRADIVKAPSLQERELS